MQPLKWHDVRLRLALRILRPVWAALIALAVLAAFGLVGSNDLEDEQLTADMKAPR